MFLSGTQPFRTGIGGPVSIVINVYNYCRTVYAHMAVIVSMVVPAAGAVPVAVMGVIMVMPVIMVSIVIVPVVGPPGAPVAGIVTPVPG